MLIFYPSLERNLKDSAEEGDKDGVEILVQTAVFAVLIKQSCEPVKLFQSATVEHKMNFMLFETLDNGTCIILEIWEKNIGYIHRLYI